MKIIADGRTGQVSWSERYDCTGAGHGDGGCHASLLVEKSDLYKSDGIHAGASFYTFQCPQCKVETNVYIPLLPFAVPSRDEWMKQQLVSAREVTRFKGTDPSKRIEEVDSECG